MISEERPDAHGARRWAWPLLLSLLVHGIAIPWILWRADARLVAIHRSAQRPELILSSTALRIERRPVPQRQAVAAAPPAPAAVVPPRRTVRARRPAPPPRRHELARIVPHAPAQPSAPPHPAPAARLPALAVQQRAFAREVAWLQRQDRTLSIATSAPQRPAAFHRSAFDAPGMLARQNTQALLTPIQHWFTGGLSCYYTRYVAEFSDGASERGVIPWPVCYPRDDDRIAALPFPHALPIPYPQPGYVLPPGTFLTPFLRSIYLHERK